MELDATLSMLSIGSKAAKVCWVAVAVLSYLDLRKRFALYDLTMYFFGRNMHSRSAKHTHMYVVSLPEIHFHCILLTEITLFTNYLCGENAFVCIRA
jgi:hypothetical protein